MYATLVFAYPVMVAIIMALFFRERLGWPSLLAIALTVGGIALLYQGDDGKPISLPGFVIVMVSALAYALYIVVVNRSRIVMSSVNLTFYAMLVCLLCIALFSLIDHQPLTLLQSPKEWIYAALLGLVPTVVHWFTWPRPSISSVPRRPPLWALWSPSPQWWPAC